MLVACSSEPVEFPSRLAPIEDNQAEWPGDGNSFPEEIQTAGGVYASGDGYWGHGRGYLQADVDTVWTAAQNIDACVDRREVDEWVVTEDTQPQFDVSYTITQTVFDLIRVEFDMTWVHERQMADADDRTTRVVIQSEKTDGSVFVGDLRGSLLLEEVEPGITSLEFVQVGTSSQRDQETSIAFVVDYFTDIKAIVTGVPLPEYER